MFCQLEVLRYCLPPSVRRTLEELPESLDETYERVLKEIKRPNRDHAQRLLQCLVVAVRPLRIDELAEVLAVDFDDKAGMPKLKASWRWENQEQALLSSCSSLIAIVDGDYGSRVVQFSHFSVKEFLTSPRLAAPIREVSRYHIYLEAAHTIMAQACLSVLLRSDDRVEEDHSVEINSPLTAYAAEHWVTHAQFPNVSSRVQNTMEHLFDPDKPYFAAWLRLHDIDLDSQTSPLWHFSPSRESNATPLYYAALCGFQDFVEHLLIKYPQQTKARGGYYVTPALAALARRHIEIARLLHRNGSSVDPPGYNMSTPLHSAACRGDLEIVQVLLECKADVNSQIRNGYPPLVYASYHSDPEAPNVVQLLLDNGANPNLQAKNGDTPLHVASRKGSLESACLLLEHGAEVEAKYLGKTAFQIASEEGRFEITKLLSEYGAKGI